MIMTHPGLPLMWAMLIAFVSVAFLLLYVTSNSTNEINAKTFSLVKLPIFGSMIGWLISNRWVLLCLKLVMVGFFLTVIVAGLYGTPIPERNFSTLMTWNLWWAGLVFSVFFLGSAWCAVCPWDAIATWLVRRRLWQRAEPNNSLNLRVPVYLKTVWPALFMFIALTWLELGVGVTINPYATALISLLMVVMATVSLAVFERKAFCKHFCPVGRTIGFYSQLSTIELRPKNQETCDNCTDLSCYHGTETVDPCPTSLVMGRLTQNSYCTSCGNCSQSCPDNNIAWRLRQPSIEAITGARPRWDEAWFMLVLLALTAFHGITMLPFWEAIMSQFARIIGDSGQLLLSFSLGLVLIISLIVGFYSVMIMLTRWMNSALLSFKQSFSIMAFTSLPLAFAYHMAHNLNHLIREGGGLTAVMLNPLGVGTLPLTMAEKHQRHLDLWMSQDVLFAIQSIIMIFGTVIALKTVAKRGQQLASQASQNTKVCLAPMYAYVLAITAMHVWMLTQAMIMRM